MYRYAIVNVRKKNDEVLGERTLGIEVTVPEFAARCGLGNIDPQHIGGDATRAAIEECLTVALPPEDAILVTVRSDLDALGGMAVLTIRAKGLELSPEALDRVRLIAEADKFAYGEWSGPRPLPKWDIDDYASALVDDLHSKLAAIGGAIVDYKLPVAERVALAERWILTGEEPTEYRRKYHEERKQIADAIAAGKIQVSTAADGKIAVVVSENRAGTSIGYCIAPIVVLLNPQFRFEGSEPHRKFTVCQFKEGYVDLRAVVSELNEREPGWGGSPTIIGSPQGSGSQLNMTDVLSVVIRHLLG
jgi:hypothetical protein